MAAPPRLTLRDHARLVPALARGGLFAMAQEVHRCHGAVADVGYGPARMLWMLGAEANKHILVDDPEAFAWGPPMAEGLAAVDGPTALVVTDGEDHKRRRRLVQPAFAVKRVDAHLGLVVAEVDRVLATWRPGDRVDAAASLRVAISRIVTRALFGEALGEKADRFAELLEPGLRYVQKLPQQRFEHDLRINPYARVQRSNRLADALVLEEVARRRAEGVDADADHDVLTALIAGVEGETLTDDELVDQVRSLMAAGFDTTAGGAAWLAVELGRNPEALAAIRAEIDGHLGDRAPTIDDLRALPLALGAVQEVLRMWPPGPAAPRETTRPTTFQGHEIPAGRRVLYSAFVTGRIPELWPDPERFDPTRWLPAAPEPVPYSFVPFGGGYRKCIGFALATLELQVLAVRLVQTVDYRLERPNPKPTGVATLSPKGGVPIEVTARR